MTGRADAGCTSILSSVSWAALKTLGGNAWPDKVPGMPVKERYSTGSQEHTICTGLQLVWASVREYSP